VPFGGHFGDCGDYHGWVGGISLHDPKTLTAWSTRSRGGGIWAPGGITVAEQSLFVATGNTFGASTWSDGEAIIRLAPDLHRSEDKRDFFAPSDWHALDERDADLGGSNPVPLDIQGPTGRQSFILALGKDGRAYLLNRNNLGGIGGSLVIETITQQPIRTAPAVYPVGGDGFVALQAGGARCPARGSERKTDNELVVLKVSAGERPAIATAWCGNVRGRGSPIVTTTDGHSDPIVWMVGAEGDNLQGRDRRGAFRHRGGPGHERPSSFPDPDRNQGPDFRRRGRTDLCLRVLTKAVPPDERRAPAFASRPTRCRIPGLANNSSTNPPPRGPRSGSRPPRRRSHDYAPPQMRAENSSRQCILSPQRALHRPIKFRRLAVRSNGRLHRAVSGGRGVATLVQASESLDSITPGHPSKGALNWWLE
jgi:hypothetical protein